MNDEFGVETQHVLLCFMISDPDLWVRAADIIKPEYFHKTLQPVVEFYKEYSHDYNTLPKIEQIKARTGIQIVTVTGIRDSDRDWCLDTTERFCRRKALERWVTKGIDYIEKDNYGQLEQELKDALLISLNKNIGTMYFEDPKQRLLDLKSSNGQVSTGWKDLDDLLYGGFNRGELNIFAGTPGSGKSLFLQNISLNLATLHKMNVVYVSLELDEGLTGKRMDTIVSGVPSKDIYKRLDFVDEAVREKGKGAGYIILKYIKQGSTVNTIKALLKEIELETSIRPDAVIVDYLDLLHPLDSRISPDNLFIKDKYVSEELRAMSKEMYPDHMLMLVTASQLNRSAVDEPDFSQANIAGGISKVNTADNLFGIQLSNVMKEMGMVELQLLKTRNSAGVGRRVKLKYDMNTLLITDMDEDEKEAFRPVKTPEILSTLQKNKVSTMPTINILDTINNIRESSK